MVRAGLDTQPRLRYNPNAPRNVQKNSNSSSFVPPPSPSSSSPATVLTTGTSVPVSDLLKRPASKGNEMLVLFYGIRRITVYNRPVHDFDREILTKILPFFFFFVDSGNEIDDNCIGYEKWFPSPPKVGKPRSVFNAASLAYIGDSIYEVSLHFHYDFVLRVSLVNFLYLILVL